MSVEGNSGRASKEEHGPLLKRGYVVSACNPCQAAQPPGRGCSRTCALTVVASWGSVTFLNFSQMFFSILKKDFIYFYYMHMSYLPVCAPYTW